MRALTLMAIVALSTAARAQDRPTVLLLPAGTRALGVGNAFVAGRSPEVIFYNPAQLGIQTGVMMSAQRYGDRSGAASMAGVVPLPLGAVGIGIQYFEFEEFGASAGPPPTTGDIASSLVASFGMGLPAIKSIRSGIALKSAREQVGGGRDESVALDVGVARDFFGRATLAFAAQNLGPQLVLNGLHYKLPARYTLGASAQAPPLATFFDLAASGSLSYLRDGTFLPAGGVELSYVPLDGWTFTGRVGVRRVEDRSDAGAMTMGAGISFDRVSLDWAFHTLEAGNGSHRVGLRVR